MREEIDKNSRPARGHGRLVADPPPAQADQDRRPRRAPRPCISFQLAGVAVTSPMVRAILAAIRRLRAPPSCA